MFKFLSIAIPLAGLIVTVLTFYYIRLDRGTVEMTQASYFYLQPGDGKFQVPAIVFAALVHGTSDRGLYVENLAISLEREDGIQHFSECWYEDRDLLRPAAFLADKQGLSANFHFCSPGYGAWYPFLPGNYTMRIFVKVAGEPEKEIGKEHFSLTTEMCQAMRKHNTGVCFVWSPGGQCYVGHAGPVGPKLNLYKINGRIL